LSLDRSGTVADELISSATKTQASIYTVRAQMLRLFCMAFPGISMEEAGYERHFNQQPQPVLVERNRQSVAR
jgi:hypothetical protein